MSGKLAVFLHMSVGPGNFHRGNELSAQALGVQEREIRSEGTFASRCLGMW